MRILVIAAATLIGAAAVAFAGEPGESEKRCDGNTREIVECLMARAKVWETRMDAAYKQALEDAEPKQREKLVEAQKLWLQYRDANCGYYRLGPGTIAGIETGYCMQDLTEARARELEQKVERH
jgi:uncharacterized protein YecT (DUF1311 family)